MTENLTEAQKNTGPGLSPLFQRRGGLGIGLVSLCIGVALAGWGFLHAGDFLVVDDRFTHADVAVVLSGLPTSRALAARDLYRQGRVDRILVIPEPLTKIEGEVITEEARQELIHLGLIEAHPSQWAERILLSSGVPPSKIEWIARPANGTIVEAHLVRARFKDRMPSSIVLITSKSALRRARFIFRHVFKPDRVRIFCSPPPSDPFEPHRWWSQPRQALTVLTEYEKLLANALTLTLTPHPIEP